MESASAKNTVFAPRFLELKVNSFFPIITTSMNVSEDVVPLSHTGSFLMLHLCIFFLHLVVSYL